MGREHIDTMKQDYKIALVHDWLNNFGGSERCVEAFTEVFPKAPIYTSVWNKKKVQQFSQTDIVTSFLQKIPGSKTNHAFFLPLMPMAFERFSFEKYDVVLSSNHACSKGIITLPSTLHICYCHTPTRYLWDFWHRYTQDPSYFGRFNFLVKFVGPLIATYLRMWDRLAADRVDYFIANSRFIAQRIHKYYRKPAVVIHPPVDVNNFKISKEVDDYFLILSRLVPYKKVDLAIQAFNETKLPLKIAGDGPEYKKLKNMAKGSNIEFLGQVSESDKQELMSRCQAFIFPAEEDFGIVPVEAMAAGRPVIALGKGGALETVVEGKTGTFFAEQTKDSLVSAIKKFQTMKFESEVIRKHAEGFDRSIFQEKIKKFINEKMNERREKLSLPE